MFNEADENRVQEIMVYVPVTINVGILVISIVQTVIWLLGPVALHSLCIVIVSVSYLGYLHRLGETVVRWYDIKYL